MGAATLVSTGTRYGLDGEGYIVPFRWSENVRRYGFVAPERKTKAEAP